MPAANRISPSSRSTGTLFNHLRGHDFDGTSLRSAALREPRLKYSSDIVPRSEKPYLFITMPGMITVLRHLCSGRSFRYLSTHFPAFLTFLLNFLTFTIRFRSHPP